MFSESIWTVRTK